MARALAPGPDVLLLDEPMSALDAKLRERLRVQIREIQQELGITTVYVTHDQEEALAVSDRVAVVRDGAFEQVGPPRDIYREPATRFVAEFIGDNNVLSGTVQEVEAGIATVEVADRELAVATGDRALTVGDRLTLCIRPERLSLSGGTTTLSATVGSREFLGETTRVHLNWRGTPLQLRTVEPPSDEVQVSFEPTDAHIVSVGDE